MVKSIFVTRASSRSADWPKLLRSYRTYHLHLTLPDKRKDTMSAPSLKRPRITYENDEHDEASVASYEHPRHNPLYGQKNAFPGLDDGGDDLLSNDPDDGLEYLRVVRYA